MSNKDDCIGLIAGNSYKDLGDEVPYTINEDPSSEVYTLTITSNYANTKAATIDHSCMIRAVM